MFESSGTPRGKNWRNRYFPTLGRTTAETTLKRLLWLYCVLWLTEGALRKWIFPEFSGPLLLLRDPLAVSIIVYAFAAGVWNLNTWTSILWGMGSVSFFITLSLGVPLTVSIIGLRTIVLHLPLIFLFEKLLTHEDVDRMGNIFLVLALPMGVLMTLQFLAPGDSTINAGAGVGSGQIGGVGERIRAPGVFSFVTGAVQYFSLVSAFALAKSSVRSASGTITVLLAAGGITLAVCVAISRTLTFSIALIVVVFLILAFRSGVALGRWLLLIFVASLVIGIATFSSVANEGLGAFRERMFEANDSEDIVVRIFSPFIIPMDVIVSAGIQGKGIGVGTNMGASLLSGSTEFVLAEKEWERVVLEMGAPLGLLFISHRIILLGFLVSRCLPSWGSPQLLPLLLVTAAGFTLIIGQIGQPTTLGFVVIGVGLAFASAKPHRSVVPDVRRSFTRPTGESRRPHFRLQPVEK